MYSAVHLDGLLHSPPQAGKEDPFQPLSDETFPSPDNIEAVHELDRDKIHAVKFVGQGEFGKVYLATYHKRDDSVDTVLREVQVAVKTVNPSVNQRGIREFTEEASLQLGLQHENIAKVLGVCMTQKPYLAVLEFIMYGARFRWSLFARGCCWIPCLLLESSWYTLDMIQ
jgi:hypothetical protein